MMDLLSLCRALAQLDSVTGCEKETAEFLEKILAAKGLFCRTDSLDDLIVRKEDSPAETLIFVPMDLPGFLAVPEEKKTRLLPLGNPDLKTVKGMTVTLSGVASLPVLSDEEKDPKGTDLYLDHPSKLGEICRINCECSEKDGAFSGRFVSGYLLLSLAMEFAAERLRPGTAVVFLAQSRQGNAAFAGNVALREKPKRAWLLSAAEEKEDKPVLAVRAGRHFSHPALIDAFSERAANAELPFKKAVLSEGDPQGQAVSASGVPCARLVLPVTDPGKDTERVSAEAARLISLALDLLA